MADFAMLQRLTRTDVRILSCRRAWGVRCARATVSAAGMTYLLCPLRVQAFLAPNSDGRSLSGVECAPF